MFGGKYIFSSLMFSGESVSIREDNAHGQYSQRERGALEQDQHRVQIPQPLSGNETVGMVSIKDDTIPKIFFFWLVKTTRIIHHNQLLFTKFGKNLRHIEFMTSKVEPTENYWTNDVKMTSKVQPAAGYWTFDRENLGTRLCYIWWAEKQRV